MLSVRNYRSRNPVFFKKTGLIPTIPSPKRKNTIRRSGRDSATQQNRQVHTDCPPDLQEIGEGIVPKTGFQPGNTWETLA